MGRVSITEDLVIRSILVLSQRIDVILSVIIIAPRVQNKSCF
ncbi:hypothetical protein HWC16_gp023 [Salmonella phage Sepoy]|uniref:Uncharacterized protein n=1 Tax=Salmonella phage Sepoy TaxID=2565517 RepID=A0A4P8NLW5_9CAUD|nr:hypothetical protein HWC16_gp023 [Salmonella phage Sepoy]QCQ65517.1 hypothetical protein Sepoy_023 [Salmonella phage Sepoy]